MGKVGLASFLILLIFWTAVGKSDDLLDCLSTLTVVGEYQSHKRVIYKPGNEKNGFSIVRSDAQVLHFIGVDGIELIQVDPWSRISWEIPKNETSKVTVDSDHVHFFDISVNGPKSQKNFVRCKLD